jgi:hypothetical protein
MKLIICENKNLDEIAKDLEIKNDIDTLYIFYKNYDFFRLVSTGHMKIAQ